MTHHVCIGAHLARLEVRVLLEEQLPWLARIRLAAEPPRSLSRQVNSFKALPIEVVS